MVLLSGGQTGLGLGGDRWKDQIRTKKGGDGTDAHGKMIRRVPAGTVRISASCL